MITTGTSHRGTLLLPNPLSSSGFISAGSTGSVAAAINDATMATTMPRLPDLKYGFRRVTRCSKGGM